MVESMEDRDLWEQVKAAKGKPLNVYDDSEGRMRTFVQRPSTGAVLDPSLTHPGRSISLDMRPTPIPPDQIAQAFDDAADFMAVLEQEHPILANAFANNPHMLHLLPQISMMLGGPAGLGIGVDVVGGLLDAMPDAVGYRSYADSMFQTQVQQMFWNDVASKFDSDAKDVTSFIFSGLEERGADRVASLAFAWLRNKTRGRAGGSFFDEQANAPSTRVVKFVKGKDASAVDVSSMTVDDQDELLLRLWNWAHAEQQGELHDAGFFGKLDAPQEFAEDLFEVPVSGMIGWLGDPEEAIRRSGLTLGQQAAYQFGLDPDDAMWTIVSGVADAVEEVVGDPLNLVSGLGAGMKAAKTIPLSIRALQKGRAVFAAKSVLPILSRGVPRLQTRNLTARATYAFMGKTVDQLFEGFGKTAAGKDAFDLIKAGNRARFLERYPQFERLPDSFFHTVKSNDLIDSPDEMASLMQHLHWVDDWDDASVINDASKALDDAKTALERAPKKTRELQLDVIRKEMQLSMMKTSQKRTFVITDLPTKPRKSIYNFVDTKTAGKDGAFTNVLRRWTYDMTRSVTREFNLFDTRQGAKNVGKLLSHYGVEQIKKDELLNEFIALDVGERMDFMLHKVVPAIGDATRNPVLQFGLVEFYKRAGVRAFGTAGQPGTRLDEAIDGAGNATRLPFLSSDMQATFQFPVSEVDQIIRRYSAVKKLSALGLGNRGLVSSTNKNRAQLVQRLRDRMGANVPEGMDDEGLYQMAYSWLGQGVDPRGWVSKTVSWPTTKILKPLDTWFRKVMLGLRPMQWMAKVVFIEEQLRSHIYEMPNMYTKPLGWVGELFSNHYLNKVEKWAKRQSAWVDDVRHQLVDGKKTVGEATEAIREAFGKAADDIIGSRKFRNVYEVDKRLASWMHQSSLPLQQAGRMPGSTLVRRVRAWKINKASDIKNKNLLDPDFRPADDLEDINGKMIETLFGEEIATARSAIIPFNWDEKMADGARRRYGHAWGYKVGKLVTTPETQLAMRRMVIKELGGDIPHSLSAEAFLETSTWKMMKGNIRRFYPDEANDAARVERWLNEKVEVWVDEMLKPALSQGTVNRGEFLNNLVENKVFKADINGHKYDINLKSAGSSRRKLADLVVDQGTFARTTPFPEEIASVPFDFRFLDGSEDHNLFRKAVDLSINLAGEKATQVFSRRPFWRAQYRKWTTIYSDLGFPEGLVKELAQEKATRLTNYVMYDISEAPTVVQKLNKVIPFFGATYEVLSTWSYKLPVATGGYWVAGAGAFARKMDRLMRALINTGVMKVTQEEDGKKNYELQVWREPETGNPLGDALSKIGYHLRRTPEVAISHLIGLTRLAGADPDMMEDALKLSEAGYGVTMGNPLDPFDYGLLSFAQFHIGQSPHMNLFTSNVVGRFLPAADVQRVSSGNAEVSLADLAEKLDVDPDDLARANSGLIDDVEDYTGIFTDDVDPADVMIAADSLVTIPNSSLMDTLVEDVFYPYGEIETPAGAIRSYVPGVLQHVLRGFGLVGTPADDAYLGDAGELDSVPFFKSPENDASINSQILEAFYYLESTEGTFTEKIFPLEKRYRELVAAGGGAKADAVKRELEALTAQAIKRATDMAAGGMILRGLGGGFFPSTGRTLRKEMDAINKYWDTKGLAEQLRGNDADGKPLRSKPVLGRMKKPEDIDEFFHQVGSWLFDPSGDDSRMFIRDNHPTMLAFLQPKTFWGAPGEPPQISSYDDYLEQIRSGKRKPVPLGVAIQRHLHAGVEQDYWAELVHTFGNDPEEHVSKALDNYAIYNEIQEKRSRAHDALDMSDDLHGGDYLEWLNERGSHDDDKYESVEEAIDLQRQAQDMLGEMLDIDLDPFMSPAEIRQWRSNIKSSLAKFGDIVEQIEGERKDDPRWKNPYELVTNAYWTQIYDRFEKSADAVWDAIGESTDTENTSLLFENLKIVMNQWAGKRFALPGNASITFPSPLDIRWQRKTDDEKRAFATKRATLPLLWLNLDDVQRILEFAPADAASFFPKSAAEMEIYTSWTVKKNEIDELAEVGQITEGQRIKMQKAAEERVKSYLLESGRGDEVTYMDLYPIEQLHVLGMLPNELEYLMPEIRFAKEVLAAEGVGPGSIKGDQLFLPMYQQIMNRAYVDQGFGDMLTDLGLTLYDEGSWDAMLPRLIVGGFTDA